MLNEALVKQRMATAENWILDSLDGYLVLREAFLIIPSHLKKYYTHAMGNQEKGREKGLMHGLCTCMTAAIIDMELFYKHKKLTSQPVVRNLLHTVPTMDGASIEILTVEWHVYEQVKSTVAANKTDNVSVELVMHCKVASCESDVLFVAVKPKSPKADCHLGAALFVTFPLPELDGEKLLNDILPHAGKQGVEVARTGRALGRCDPESKDFQKFSAREACCLGFARLL